MSAGAETDDDCAEIGNRRRSPASDVGPRPVGLRDRLVRHSAVQETRHRCRPSASSPAHRRRQRDQAERARRARVRGDRDREAGGRPRVASRLALNASPRLFALIDEVVRRRARRRPSTRSAPTTAEERTDCRRTGRTRSRKAIHSPQRSVVNALPNVSGRLAARDHQRGVVDAELRGGPNTITDNANAIRYPKVFLSTATTIELDGRSARSPAAGSRRSARPAWPFELLPAVAEGRGRRRGSRCRETDGGGGRRGRGRQVGPRDDSCPSRARRNLTAKRPETADFPLFPCPVRVTYSG